MVVFDRYAQGEGTDNAALTDIRGDFPKRSYVIGQWSRFVRPGWLRIGVSNHSAAVLITAFKNPKDGSFAVVAVNPSTKKIPQEFALRGFRTDSVTPWITSQQSSLSPQVPVAVRGDNFSYTLPALSVTTFSGTITKAERSS